MLEIIQSYVGDLWLLEVLYHLYMSVLSESLEMNIKLNHMKSWQFSYGSTYSSTELI